MPELKSIESESNEQTSQVDLDPVFQDQIDRLYRTIVYARWAAIVFLWSTVGLYSLWELRYPIELTREYFTWAAVKYGLYFQPIPAVGLGICVAMMASTLVWQSRNIIWGISEQERERLAKQVCQIRKQGSSHPLWNFVIGTPAER